jgi:thymidylate synthase
LTPDDTDEERVQLEIAQQVRSTKATHGAEITQIDARIEQLDNKMRREITSVSAAKVLEFKEGDFKEG